MHRLRLDTLFGRLTVLLLGFALLSHVLALSALSEFRPHPPGPPPIAQGGTPPHPPGPPPDGPPGGMPAAAVLLDVGVRLAVLTVAAWIAAAWVARPMRRLASAAASLQQGLGTQPGLALPEDGPRECREASQGFNRLQAQILSHLQERDRFVAAVSHDLRTPLTRLRLRAEDLADPAQQASFRRDIEQMEQMIAATLDHFRGAAQGEAHQRLDVQSLVHTVVDDQQASGHLVCCEGEAAPLPAAPVALRRCLDNLIENAVRYGGGAQVLLQDSPQQLCIEVRDHGPGIPPEHLAQVMAPFYRVDASRNRHSGGVGLGLAIAHEIARLHRGSLVLRNLPGGGLAAMLTLPR